MCARTKALRKASGFPISKSTCFFASSSSVPVSILSASISSIWSPSSLRMRSRSLLPGMRSEVRRKNCSKFSHAIRFTSPRVAQASICDRRIAGCGCGFHGVAVCIIIFRAEQIHVFRRVHANDAGRVFYRNLCARSQLVFAGDAVLPVCEKHGLKTGGVGCIGENIGVAARQVPFLRRFLPGRDAGGIGGVMFLQEKIKNDGAGVALPVLRKGEKTVGNIFTEKRIEEK